MPPAELPVCPLLATTTDDEHSVCNVSGAGGARRTYKCSCGYVWSQELPGDLQVGEMPDIKPSHRAQFHGGAKRGRDGLGYRCSKCGELRAKLLCNAVASVPTYLSYVTVKVLFENLSQWMQISSTPVALSSLTSYSVHVS